MICCVDHHGPPIEPGPLCGYGLQETLEDGAGRSDSASGFSISNWYLQHQFFSISSGCSWQTWQDTLTDDMTILYACRGAKSCIALRVVGTFFLLYVIALHFISCHFITSSYMCYPFPLYWTASFIITWRIGGVFSEAIFCILVQSVKLPCNTKFDGFISKQYVSICQLRFSSLLGLNQNIAIRYLISNYIFDGADDSK